MSYSEIATLEPGTLFLYFHGAFDPVSAAAVILTISKDNAFNHVIAIDSIGVIRVFQNWSIDTNLYDSFLRQRHVVKPK
jgi:hypothetical protein